VRCSAFLVKLSMESLYCSYRGNLFHHTMFKIKRKVNLTWFYSFW